VIVDGEVSGSPLVLSWRNGKHFTLNKTVSGGSLVIKNMKFMGNRTSSGGGSDGGGISLSGNGPYILDSTRFENINNQALSIGYGTVVELLNSSFVNNFVGASHGGAINTRGVLTVSNCLFEKNSEIWSNYSGGAIGIYNPSGETVITKSVFLENVTNGRGGAVSVYQSNQSITIDECYFEGNEVTGNAGNNDGGAVSIYSPNLNTIFLLKNSTFYNNIAGDDAGAVFVENTGGSGSAKIENCTFYKNIAKGGNNYSGEGSGGAIQISSTGGLSSSAGTILTLNNSTFVKNIAENERGGAIGVFNGTLFATVRYYISNNIFLGNEIYEGTGAVRPDVRYSNIGGPTTDNGGNIGLDYSAAINPTTGPNLLKAFGTNNPQLSTNFSQVSAANRIIPSLSIIPNDGTNALGLADGKGVVTTLLKDQREYDRNTTNPDVGSVEILWVRFNAGEGEWTGLNDSYEFDGENYYKSSSNVTDFYFKVTYSGGTVLVPTATLTPPTGKIFDKWVLDDGNDDTEWDPSGEVTANVLVKALWKSAALTVTYYPNGGGGTAKTINCAADGTHTILNYDDVALGFSPPPNHSFAGWNTVADGSGISYGIGSISTFSVNIELYAQWQDNTPIPGIRIQEMEPVCSNETEIRIPYELLYFEYAMEYVIYFSNEAKNAGFVDKTRYSALPDGYITIPVPAGVPQGKYKGSIFLRCDLNPDIISEYSFEIEILESVRIVRQPVSEIFGCEGGNFNLSVVATGDNLTYQWYHDDRKIAGATSDHYGDIVSPETLGIYYVEVSGTCDTIVSNEAIVGMYGATRITRQPLSETIGCEGGRFNLSVEAAGENLTYQWYYNGKKIEGATSDHYENEISAETVGFYYVEVTGACGVVVSDRVTVGIHAGTRITSQPITDFIGCKDESFSLSVEATGENLTYQWYHNGQKIPGATSNHYENVLSSEMVGHYYVEVSGACGTIISNESNVRRHPETRSIQQPVPWTFSCEGDGFNLSIEVVGENPTYQWYHNGQKITGAVSSHYENVLSSETTGYYHVVVKGVCDSVISDRANVEMNRLTILMKWDDVLYIENVDSRYVRFQWYKDGQAIAQYGTAMYYTDSNGLLGTYFVRAYYSDGTYDESCPITFTESVQSSGLSVYPNPVPRFGQLMVKSDDLGESYAGAQITIYNLMGQKVYSSRATGSETAIQMKVTEGTYLMHIISPGGKKTVKKIMVK
ncbi:MAG: T9SS type A sorting domain-containing protein, partial [Dysgonamonadaceae bacterium]|nr:T9SS type A sorting domain-containing protein [Dysgonamonadaceae bacterium]